VAPRSDWDQTIFSVPGGTQSKILEPGETVSLDYTWDQKDSEGNQIAPGWYYIVFNDMIVKHEDHTLTTNPRASVLIEYPQGTIEKSIDVNQYQTVDGITVMLERVELTEDSTTFYAFFIPPGYIPQALGPSDAFTAFAGYSFDNTTVYAGDAAFGAKDDGIKLIWGDEPAKLQPIPADSTEITFTIIQINDWPGPWEFRIPLE
jgi:hypothetical protein